MYSSNSPERKMTDIHMHLIPGVDDGADDMMMARILLLRAREQGIHQIFATPHSSAFDDSEQDVRGIFHNLVANAEKVFPDMTLYLGSEVYCEADIMGQVLEALRSGRYPTMNGSPYVLMEFSMWVEPEGALPCVEAMTHAGFIPIVAHMERYQYLRGNVELVDRLRSAGALIQVNAYDLFDEMDNSIRSWARQLVLEQKVDFLGTDAHRTYHRPPSAKMGLNWLYENIDPTYADAIAWGHAQTLISSERQIIMTYEMNSKPHLQETTVSVILQLTLKYEKPEFRLEFQACRNVTPEKVWLEDEPNIFGKKDLKDYTYAYNGRTYHDITSLYVEKVEELSKTAFIGKDIHGEKSLITYTDHPTRDFTGSNKDIRVLVYLIFDGKNVHMIVMQGMGSIANLTFYDNLLSADIRFQPFFEKLGWPTTNITWK